MGKKGHKNGLRAMSAEEEMAAGKRGYEKGLRAMSAEARTAGYDESWEKQCRSLKAPYIFGKITRCMVL